MAKKPRTKIEILAKEEPFNGGKPFWPAENDVKASAGIFMFNEHMQIDRYRRFYNLTKNPLWVWTTIRFCSLHPRERIKNWEPWDILEDRSLIDKFEASEEDQNSPNYDKASIEARDRYRAILSALPHPIPLPKWCQIYLGNCAATIVDQSVNENISAKDAVSKIPDIFGFTRKGWNAFAEDRKENARQWIFNNFEHLVYDEGLSKAEARKRILEQIELEDDRNLQRILSYYSGLYPEEED